MVRAFFPRSGGSVPCSLGHWIVGELMCVQGQRHPSRGQHTTDAHPAYAECLSGCARLMSRMHERRGFLHIEQMCFAVRRDGYEVYWPLCHHRLVDVAVLGQQPLRCKQFGSLTVSIFLCGRIMLLTPPSVISYCESPFTDDNQGVNRCGFE